MKTLTINDLSKICNQQIKKGNGNLKILLSDDDEGNGYHELFYQFTPAYCVFDNDCLLPYGVRFEDLKDYIVLG